MPQRLLLLLVLAPWLGGCVAEPTMRGPLPVRNNHPAQLTVQHLPLHPVETPPAGDLRLRWQASYSSLFLSGAANGNTFAMDGEYLRTSLACRLGLGADTEFGLELPFAHTSGGFLDSFLIDYHDALGLPNQDRHAVPKNNFRVAASQGGTTVWSLDDEGFALLDVPLYVSHTLWRPEDGLGVAVRAGIELPTGDDRRGFGSGEPDYALGVLLQRRWLGCEFYAQLQHTFAGTPRQSRDAGFAFADVTALALAAELPLTADLAAFVALEYETSTLRELDLRTVGRNQFLLWFGGRWLAAPHCAVEAALGEDLQGYVSPDFTAWLGVALL